MTSKILLEDQPAVADPTSQEDGMENLDSSSVNSDRDGDLIDELNPGVGGDGTLDVDKGAETEAKDQNENLGDSQSVHSLELQMGDIDVNHQVLHGSDAEKNTSTSFAAVNKEKNETVDDEENSMAFGVNHFLDQSSEDPDQVTTNRNDWKARMPRLFDWRKDVLPPQNNSVTGSKNKANVKTGQTGVNPPTTIIPTGNSSVNSPPSNPTGQSSANPPVVPAGGNSSVIPVLSALTVRKSDNYPPDCYSFLSLYGPFDDGTFFGIGLMVFIFQITLILMMLLSVLHPQWGTNGDSDNPGLNLVAGIIAANTSPIVRYTQYAALAAYVLFAEASMLDITIAVETFPNFAKVAGGDKVWCIVFSCTLRLLQGLMAMFAALLLIITSETAVDIVLNFTAVNFISHLDNSAFRLALWGKYGPKLEKEAMAISTKQLPPCMSRSDNYTRFRCTITTLGIMLLLLLSGIIFVQNDHNVWRTQVLRVEFQNENLQTYSGCYGSDRNATSEINTYKRNIYTSSQVDGVNLGYCIDDRRWKLFKSGIDACDAKDNELAYSAKTYSFDVSTAFGDAWFSASGAPLDLYFIELKKGASDLEGQCSLLDNGECNNDFNGLEFKYDGGDCCSATCSHSICGVGTLTKAFGVPIVTGNGFPKCRDPTMVPISIQLGKFTMSEGSHLRKEDFISENPDLLLECDGKAVLSLVLTKNMSSAMQTVHVADRAACTLTIKNETYPEEAIWNIDYSIFIGDRAVSERKIVEGNSGRDGIVSFLTIPDCMLEQLSEHLDIKTMYNDIHTKQALYWMVNDATGNSDCRDDFFTERYALSVFSFSAPIANGRDRSWINTNPTCLWFTTTCDTDGLSELNLDFLNLQGTIPQSIGLLTSFSKIEMGGNSLNGTIPIEIGALTSLEYLGLRFAGVTGSFPSEIGLMSKLESLYLSGNALIGSIPSQIGRLSSLEYLALSKNQLTGNIPTEIGLLSRAESLVMSANGLTGSIPSEIGHLSLLMDFECFSNKLVGTIPSHVGLLSRLRSLWLSTNSLSGTIPSEIGFISSLETINLSESGLTGKIPSEIGSSSGTLWYLVMSDNALSGTIPSEMGLLSKLEILNLDDNVLTGTFPSEIGNMSSLETFWLEGNALTGSIPSEVGHMASLKSLWLDDNSLTGSIPSEIGLLSALTTVYLNGNTLSGTIPSEIGCMSSLIYLYIKGNALTGTLPTEIGLLTNFEYLNLRENGLTGTIPTVIGNILSFKTLSLWSNLLTGQIPTEIGFLSQLESIYLDGNALTGTIPTEIGGLSSLIFLELWENALSGSIPSQIGDLTNLKRLNLENNTLTGAIPSELGLLLSVDCLALLAGNNFNFIPPEVEGKLC